MRSRPVTIARLFLPCTARQGTVAQPFERARDDLAKTEVYRKSQALLESLELRKDFALRLGELDTHDWKLGASALKSIQRKSRLLEPDDFVPNIAQKGVDLRIGLDIARLALDRSVQSIVVVTADSDLIPALKFARREGLRVFLCHFNHRVKRELKAHTDDVISLGSEFHHHMPHHGVVLQRVG